MAGWCWSRGHDTGECGGPPRCPVAHVSDGDVVLVSGACPRGDDRMTEMSWTRWVDGWGRHSADSASVVGERRSSAVMSRWSAGVRTSA